MPRKPVDPGSDTTLDPGHFRTYQEYLRAVRIQKGMNLSDVSRASAHPDSPGAVAKLSTISRMEHGGAEDPTFRVMCRYSRGYGVPLHKLEPFFRGDSVRSRANKTFEQRNED